MNHFRRLWIGPTGTDAWKLSGQRHDSQVRIWPMKFQTQDSYRSFCREVSALVATHDRLQIASLYRDEEPEIRSEVRYALDDQNVSCSIEDFQGVDASRAFSYFSISFSTIDSTPNLRYDISFMPRYRGPRFDLEKDAYLTVSHGQSVDPSMSQFPAVLDDIHMLVEKWMRPMTAVDRLLRRKTFTAISQEQRETKTQIWSVGIVAAVLGAVVTGLIAAVI